MSKAYETKAWKWFTVTGKGLTGLMALDEQDALKAKEEKIVAAEWAATAVLSGDADPLLTVDKDGDCALEGTVSLDEVELDGAKLKLCEFKEKCRAR